jgi:hypothetical protein
MMLDWNEYRDQINAALKEMAAAIQTLSRPMAASISQLGSPPRGVVTPKSPNQTVHPRSVNGLSRRPRSVPHTAA